MIHFATFADGNYGIRSAGARLQVQAQKSGDIFQTSKVYDLKDLELYEKGYIDKHRKFIKSNPRGFGLCFWKPSFILAALNNIEEGDILIALDAGCQFNFTEISIKRFFWYVEVANKFDGLFMQLVDGQFGIADLRDSSWCNTHLIKRLNSSQYDLETNQIQAGILILKNSQKIRNLITQWKALCEENEYQFLIGIADELKQKTRWEQSIFSLLVKKHNLPFIPDETYWFPKWSDGLDYPIWAMRNRSGGDAYRRNFSDLVKILSAKAIRGIQGLLRKNPLT